MLTTYINAAMAVATYEILKEDDGTSSYYGEIPPCRGVYAAADTLKRCQEELQEVLEDWLLLGFRLGHTIPIIDGIDLNLPVQQEIA